MRPRSLGAVPLGAPVARQRPDSWNGSGDDGDECGGLHVDGDDIGGVVVGGDELIDDVCSKSSRRQRGLCTRKVGLFRAQGPLPCRWTNGCDRYFRRCLRMQVWVHRRTKKN
jgi:hypothetical protein